MPENSQFDAHAKTYHETVESALQASGETTSYFAELKATLTRRELVEMPSKVLDFGCGVGFSTRALSRQFNSAILVGCDPSAMSIEQARVTSDNHSGQLQFVAFSGERLPFSD